MVMQKEIESKIAFEDWNEETLCIRKLKIFCSDCGGEGFTIGIPRCLCPFCDGSGVTIEEEILEVKKVLNYTISKC
jgi:DnaJ-class molecular chaperone